MNSDTKLKAKFPDYEPRALNYRLTALSALADIASGIAQPSISRASDLEDYISIENRINAAIAILDRLDIVKEQSHGILKRKYATKRVGTKIGKE